MATAFVRASSSTSGSVSLTGVTAGNLLVAWMGSFGGDASAASTMSDGINTYTRRKTILSASNTMGIWTAVARLSGTVTLTGTITNGNFTQIVLAEYAGTFETVNASGSSGASNSPLTLSAISVITKNNLIVTGMFNSGGGGGQPTASYSPANLTNRILVSGGAGPSLALLADRFVTLPDTYGSEVATVTNNTASLISVSLALQGTPPTSSDGKSF